MPESEPPEQRLSERLREAGLGEQRFIPVVYEDGHKQPVETGWQSRKYPAELLGDATGVVCGDGLVVVDDDTHKPGVTAPEQLGELRDTFTAGTMHGGTHHYYNVVGEQPRSRSPKWGDIQSAGDMVVAPGAEFTHGECGEHCEQSGTGQYTVLQDVPIATVNPEDYEEIFGVTTEVKADESTAEDTNPTFDVDERLTRAVEHDEKFRKLWQWGKSGRSTSDNSSRETALAQKLLFYIGSEKKVRKVLSGLNLPKWGSRGESYRKSVMRAAWNYYDGGFDSEQSSSGQGDACRDTAIQVVAGGVLDGLYSRPVGRCRTKELTESDKVEVEQDQVKTVLDALEEAGYLRYERPGRKGYWVVDGFKSGDCDIPAAGDEFYQQFKTRQADNQQKASWMENNEEY